MNKPVIELNGKKYEIKELKARVWREVTEFETNKKELSNVEYVDKHAEILAKFFDLSADEILDKMDLADVTLKYLECYRYMFDMLYAKTKELGNIKGGGVK